MENREKAQILERLCMHPPSLRENRVHKILTRELRSRSGLLWEAILPKNNKGREIQSVQWDFPGGPVAETPYSQCRAHGFLSLVRELRSFMLCNQKKPQEFIMNIHGSQSNETKIRSSPCLLHWQADSLPLSHQGSYTFPFLLIFFLDKTFVVVFLVFYDPVINFSQNLKILKIIPKQLSTWPGSLSVPVCAWLFSRPATEPSPCAQPSLFSWSPWFSSPISLSLLVYTRFSQYWHHIWAL